MRGGKKKSRAESIISNVNEFVILCQQSPQNWEKGRTGREGETCIFNFSKV